MEKTVFKNQTFQILIIVALGLLLCWNLYTFLFLKSLVALIPIIVQITVLVLVLMKNKYAKIGVKIWAIILMIGGGLVILGKLLKLLIGDDISDGIEKLILNIIIFTVGLFIYSFNQKTVEVKQIDKEIT
jgi:energy-converting hydrogenase Eha subunit E